MLNRSTQVKASPNYSILKPSEGKLAEHGGTDLKFQHEEIGAGQIQMPG